MSREFDSELINALAQLRVVTLLNKIEYVSSPKLDEPGGDKALGIRINRSVLASIRAAKAGATQEQIDEAVSKGRKDSERALSKTNIEEYGKFVQ